MNGLLRILHREDDPHFSELIRSLLDREGIYPPERLAQKVRHCLDSGNGSD